MKKQSTLFGGRVMQRGYTLIELGIALAILAVVIVGTVQGVQGILLSNRTNDLLKSIPQYVANATKVMATQANLSDATTDTLVQLGVFPREKVVGASPNQTIRHEHGGTLLLGRYAPAVGSYGANQTFALVLTNIPQRSCADVISGLDAIAYQMSVDNVAVGVAAPAAALPAAALPGTEIKGAAARSLTLATLATQCGNDGTKTVYAVIPRS